MSDGSRIPHAMLKPVTLLLKSLSAKWKLEILFAIYEGNVRFGALHRAIPGITQPVLAGRLTELVNDGLITRRDLGKIPLHVEYGFTDASNELKPIFDALIRWAQRHKPALLPARQQGRMD